MSDHENLKGNFTAISKKIWEFADANSASRIEDLLNDADLVSSFKSTAWQEILQIKPKANSSYSLLMWSIEKGHSDLAKIIIDQSNAENLAYKDSSGSTALMMAVEYKRSDIVKLLIEKMHQEHLALKNNEGETALHLCRQVDIANMLINAMDRDNLNLKNNKGETALIKCAFHNMHKQVNEANNVIMRLLLPKLTVDEINTVANYGSSASDIIDFSHDEQKRKMLEQAIDSKSKELAVKRNPITDAVYEAEVLPELPDPIELVKGVIASGSTFDAINIGEDISDICSQYFAGVAKMSEESALRGMASIAIYNSLLERIDQSQKLLQDLQANPEKLTVPEGIAGWPVRILRSIRLAKDPKASLSENTNDISATIKSSLSASGAFIQATEAFQAHHPQIRGQVDKLEQGFDEGMRLISEMEAAEEKPHSPVVIARIKQAFSDARDVAILTKLNVLLSIESSDKQLDEEVVFVGKMKMLRATTDAGNVRMAQIMTQIKSSINDDLRGMIGGRLSEQFDNMIELHRSVEAHKQSLIEYQQGVSAQATAKAAELSPVS